MTTIRHAYREDVPTILGFIQDLADYEKESDAVKATVQSLENTIAFASPGVTSPQNSLPVTEDITATRPARCLLVFTEEGKAAGMAVYFYNYSTWRSKSGIYLEDLYVDPSYRGKGYGKKLLSALAKEVVAMDGARLDWSVLKWNEPSIKVYEHIGATAMNEWLGMRVEGAPLTTLANLTD
ncbi:acyl-CoA N-acyltransferase [Trichoderma chlorosporum]